LAVLIKAELGNTRLPGKIADMEIRALSQPIRRRLQLLLTLLLSLLVFFPLAAAAQENLLTAHFVQPGDTWLALAWRYGLTTAALQSANPQPNPAQQPAIGAMIQIPAAEEGSLLIPRPAGRLVRSNDSGLMRLAIASNLNLWELALQNDLSHPYQPLLYRPIYIPADGPLREFPTGFDSLELSQSPAVPGQALAFRGRYHLNEPVAAWLENESFQVFDNDSQTVGLTGTGAFYSPGNHEIRFQVGSGPLWVQPLRFVPGEWTFDQVTLTGEAAAIDAESRRLERERLFILWNQATAVPQWTAPFQLPIESYLEISSEYGARRSYNGGPFSTYHEGLDFSAYGGTPVYAPAAGTVVVAERLYVRGGAVIIDHGLGIYSGFYHLSEVVAEVGQKVETGQLLGNVGTTGFSSGNHLHWDLLVDGIWVSPAAWLEQDMACWILEGWGMPCTPS
jgi:murein DD-endopeptidase MepM/ murein hydrolase activator NlpD